MAARNWPRIVPFFRTHPAETGKSSFYTTSDGVRQHEPAQGHQSRGSFPNDDALIVVPSGTTQHQQEMDDADSTKAALNRFHGIMFDESVCPSIATTS
jgi:hypothetical protein